MLVRFFRCFWEQSNKAFRCFFFSCRTVLRVAGVPLGSFFLFRLVSSRARLFASHLCLGSRAPSQRVGGRHVGDAVCFSCTLVSSVSVAAKSSGPFFRWKTVG